MYHPINFGTIHLEKNLKSIQIEHDEILNSDRGID